MLPSIMSILREQDFCGQSQVRSSSILAELARKLESSKVFPFVKMYLQGLSSGYQV